MSTNFNEIDVGQQTSLKDSKDELESIDKKPKLSISGKDIPITANEEDSETEQVITNLSRNQDMDDVRLQHTGNHPELDKTASSNIGQHSQLRRRDDRNAPAPLNFNQLDVKPKAKWKGRLAWRILTAPLAFFKSVAVGAAVGGAGGAAAGAGVGGAAGTGVMPVIGTVTGAAGGAAGGAAVGGVVGGGAGALHGFYAFGREVYKGELADKLFGSGKRSQHVHARMAFATLQRSGWQPTGQEANNLKSPNVTDDQWKALLHVPKEYKLSVHRWSNGVKGWSNRQKIREAVMLYVAKHGTVGAADFRKRLIAKARQGPKTLQTEINKLKGSHLADQVHNVQHPGELRQIMRNNPDVFAHPSLPTGLESDLNYRGLQDHRGMQAALGVARRLNQQGRVYDRDRIDLLNAMKTAGVANPPDVLKKFVGKDMTTEVKHAVAQAIYQHIVPQMSFDTVQQKQLQSTLDPEGFKAYVNDPNRKPGVNEKQYRNMLDKPVFKDVNEGQRKQVANDELDVLENIANREFDQNYRELKDRLETGLRGPNNQFITPMQEHASQLAAEQNLVDEPSEPQENDHDRMQRFQGMFNQYAPAPPNLTQNDGAEFQQILTDLNLNHDEFDPWKLRQSIANEFMNTWGRNAERLPSPDQVNEQTAKQMKRDMLNAISGYFYLHKPENVHQTRANEIRRQAEELRKGVV